MAADSSGKTSTRIPRAEYLTIPTPNPNGADPTGAATPPLTVRSVEEVPTPAPAKSTTDALVDAAGKVFAALTAQVAYHEKEAQRLRRALDQFAAVATPQVRQNATQDVDIDRDLLNKLLQAADRFAPEPDKKG